MKPFPKIVCLCGSTRFKDQFEQANKAETLAGKIVLSVGFFGHSDAAPPTEEQKKLLDELHLEKIRLADEVLFLNVDGYIGSSTKRELAYAVYSGKKIRFLEPERGDDFMQLEAHSLGQFVASFLAQRRA